MKKFKFCLNKSSDRIRSRNEVMILYNEDFNDWKNSLIF